ncbi:MAG: FHA domain-containing protein [Enterobacterales bacterium]|nr:FHA domain-containing protein [Enterobacterales bacterium]
MAYLALVVEDVVINKWKLDDEIIILGRARDCDIQIDDQSVSSKHARIIVEQDPFLKNNSLFYIEDLKSTNGTRLNENNVSKQKLSDGDWLGIGFTRFQFVNNNSTNLDETAVILSE